MASISDERHPTNGSGSREDDVALTLPHVVSVDASPRQAGMAEGVGLTNGIETDESTADFDEEEQWDFLVNSQDDCFSCLKLCSTCGAACEIGSPHPRASSIPGFHRRIGLMHVIGAGPVSALDRDPPFKCVLGPAWPMSICMVCVIIGVPAVVFSIFGAQMHVAALG